MHPREQLASQLVLHGYMHAGVLLLSLAGAAVAFWLLQHRLPSAKAASFFGASFAVISFFAVVLAFEAAGLVAAAAWLLVGSTLVALSSGLFVGHMAANPSVNADPLQRRCAPPPRSGYFKLQGLLHLSSASVCEARSTFSADHGVEASEMRTGQTTTGH